MKQINIFGEVEVIQEESNPNFHPQFNKKINDNYYGSNLNKFASELVTRKIIVNNIDMITNIWNGSNIRIIESKHTNEAVTKGQGKNLSELTKMHNIDCYTIRGEYPYLSAEVYSFKTGKTKVLTQSELIDFLGYGIK